MLPDNWTSPHRHCWKKPPSPPTCTNPFSLRKAEKLTFMNMRKKLSSSEYDNLQQIHNKQKRTIRSRLHNIRYSAILPRAPVPFQPDGSFPYSLYYHIHYFHYSERRIRSLSSFLPAPVLNFSRRPSTVRPFFSSSLISSTIFPESIIRIRFPRSSADCIL